MRIHATHDPKAIFPSRGCFYWLDVPEKFPNDARIDPEKASRRIRKAVIRHMAGRGFSIATYEKPDLLIAYEIALERALDPATVTSQFDYSPTWNPEPEEGEELEKGSLILDFVDARTRKLVWRGFANDKIVVDVTEEQREKRINAAVRGIVELYPPKQPLKLKV